MNQHLAFTPFVLPGFTELESPPDEKWLRRTRRKLMAEFELQDSVTIHFNGKEVDKATIIGLLEELAAPERKTPWWEASQMPAIRNLFENGILPQTPAQIAPFLNKNYKIFAPFLGSLLRDLLLRHCQDASAKMVNDAVGLIQLLHPEDREVVYRKTRNWIRSSCEDLINWCDSPERTEILRNNSDAWALKKMVCLSTLPSSFMEARNTLAFFLGFLAMDIAYKEEDFYLSHSLVKGALKLKVDREHRYGLYQIERQINHFLHLQESRRKAPPQRLFPWIAGGSLIIFALFIFRILGENGCLTRKKPRLQQSQQVAASHLPAPDSSHTSPEKGEHHFEPEEKITQDLFLRLHRFGEQIASGQKEQFIEASAKAGSQPYQHLISSKPNETGQGLAVFENNSNREVVVFILQKGFDDIEWHFYLPKGKKYHLKNIPLNEYEVAFFAGNSPVIFTSASRAKYLLFTKEIYESFTARQEILTFESKGQIQGNYLNLDSNMNWSIQSIIRRKAPSDNP